MSRRGRPRRGGTAGRAAAGRGPTPTRSTAPSRRSPAYPAARVRRRGPLAAGVARPGGRRQRVPAAGRRLRRDLRGVHRRQHPREARVILQMAVVLTYSAGVPVVKVGRIAGQFAKPRSAHRARRRRRAAVVPRPHRQRHRRPRRGPRPRSRAPRAGVPPVGLDPEPAAGVHEGRVRRPGPGARVEPGVRGASPEGRRYEQLAGEIDRALRFMRACGVDTEANPKLHEVDVYTSHEALILGYEEALTRQDSLTGDWYDCSAHMLWIGERTRQLDGAHVEFLRGVGNPIGCKVGPTPPPTRCSRCARRSTRNASPGGSRSSPAWAPTTWRPAAPLLRAVTDAGHPVVWACDPMHGNTFTAPKRTQDAPLRRHRRRDRRLLPRPPRRGHVAGGIHVELTGDNVTECLGGADEMIDADLDNRYETICDPRLNGRQSSTWRSASPSSSPVRPTDPTAWDALDLVASWESTTRRLRSSTRTGRCDPPPATSIGTSGWHRSPR